MKIRDNIVYLKEFIAEFKNTGTICPSSTFAGRALSNPLATSRGPKNIIEIGAGTGVVTEVILENLVPGDHLTICEINPRFMSELKERIENHPIYETHKDNISFFEGPIQHLSEDRSYDVLVCALPFLNFDVELVDEIFSKLLRISSDDAVMTYFEYIGLRKLGKVIPLKDRQRRIQAVEEYMDERYNPRRIDEVKVWLNFLPINIYTLNMAPEAA